MNAAQPLTENELGALAAELEGLDAPERLRLLSEQFAGRIVATSSFGLQAAVMLKLLKDHAPNIPIVFIDTGYLFPETYRYAETLKEQLGFEVETYLPGMTAAQQAALYGRLWEQGPEELDQYARINKVEPMNRALQELGADVWLSGVRRSHSSSRAEKPILEAQSKTLKVYPIIDWSDEEVERYMKEHDLPRHPLAKLGYVTMGDWHSTKPVEDAGSAEGTRFNGQKYECGLHLDSGVQDFQI